MQVPTTPEYFLAVLGVLLFFGLLLPRILKPLHLPFATSLILVGSAMGPHGLGFVEPDPHLTLFGFLGAMFQMLLAGIETRAMGIRPRERTLARILICNALLPGVAGLGIARALGYDWRAAFFVGIVFLSSSIIFVFSLVSSLGFTRFRVGRALKRVAVIEDMSASILAFLLFQTVAGHHRFPLPILAGLLLASVVILRMFLPEVVSFLFSRLDEEGGNDHEARLWLTIAVLLLVIFGYSTFAVHPVIAAFLVGFVLAEVPAATELRERLGTLGHGLFIPVFLFILGLETDFGVLVRFASDAPPVLAIMVGALATKIVGGYAGARWARLTKAESMVVAFASTVKLTVPLATTYAARDLGIIDANLFSAIVILSVVTSFLAPLILPVISRRSRALGDG